MRVRLTLEPTLHRRKAEPAAQGVVGDGERLPLVRVSTGVIEPIDAGWRDVREVRLLEAGEASADRLALLPRGVEIDHEQLTHLPGLVSEAVIARAEAAASLRLAITPSISLVTSFNVGPTASPSAASNIVRTAPSASS